MKLKRFVSVIPSNFVVKDGSLHIDEDFANNMQIYLEYFEEVTILSNLSNAQGNGMLAATRPFAQMNGHERVRLQVLPFPYREDKYYLHRNRMRNLFLKSLETASVLHITPHAPLDWPTLSARCAFAARVPYVIQADWDLWSTSKQIYSQLRNPIKRTRKRILVQRFLAHYADVLDGAAVALLHGSDVFTANEHRTPNPRLIHNPSITKADHIDDEALSAKKARVPEQGPLRIIYAGRLEDMKGPIEWLRTLRSLKQAGLSFDARWFGWGTLEDKFKEQVTALGLHDAVTLHKNVPRDVLLEEVRHSDIFLFCHKLRESPRNLIEALACGTPIIGFESPYALDLVAEHGGGRYAAVGDTNGLAAAVLALDADRGALADLVQSAARSGSMFSREDAMKERIELMMEHATIRKT